MSSPRSSTRARLINAALELFASQGITETTTRQIAELAQVNEVTLFRHFGNKHGLLLAVLEDSAAAFTDLGESLIEQANQTNHVDQALLDYTKGCIQALQTVPEFVRSVVGEAGHYPAENRQALGRVFTEANRCAAEYLSAVLAREQLRTRFPVASLASLLNSLLLGYVVLQLTSEFHELWQDQEEFLESLVQLFLKGAVLSEKQENSVEETLPDQLSQSLIFSEPANREAESFLETQLITPSKRVETSEVADLPTSLVHLILQRARKLGRQDYALTYILFAAGLSPEEVINLERTYQTVAANQHLLQVRGNTVRQVPVNQWILGTRYGSYTRNPLTQWLKSRKDGQSAMFLNEKGQPLTELEVRWRWQVITEGLATPENHPIAIEQTRQTWCVEMLMKGMNLEDLSIIGGWDLPQLQPYARRAREKNALEQALRLDRQAYSPQSLAQ